MTAFSLLMMLIGIFIILNSANFLKVLKGEADISFLQPDKGKTATGDNSTPGSASTGGGGGGAARTN